ncbi:MAG: TspO/MBR family protein [Candidatus Omnitrophota bacterium]
MNLWFSALFAIVVAYPIILSVPNVADIVWYRNKTKKRERRWPLWIAPPSWVFQLIWPLLYACIIVAGIFFIKSVDATAVASTMYQAIMSLLVVNLAANVMWTRLFFGSRNVIVALLDAIVIFGSAVAVVVLFAVESHWISFGVYMPYAIWSLFAAILNAMWVATFGMEIDDADKRRPAERVW